MQSKYGFARLSDENCGVQSMNKQTDTQTDRKETQGPKIMYIDIRYLHTVIKYKISNSITGFSKHFIIIFDSKQTS